MTEPHEPEVLPAELERELELALRSAWRPVAIEPSRHERILELALEDPFAPPSAEELVESERLRQALEGRGDHENLALARALAAAMRPTAPSEEALAPPRAKTRERSRVLYVSFGAATAVFAAAAALALVIGGVRSQAPSTQAVVPAVVTTSRSSAPLFEDRFTLEGTTARVDRIASARQRELRDNRYAAWGVR